MKNLFRFIGLLIGFVLIFLWLNKGCIALGRSSFYMIVSSKTDPISYWIVIISFSAYLCAVIIKGSSGGDTKKVKKDDALK